MSFLPPTKNPIVWSQSRITLLLVLGLALATLGGLGWLCLGSSAIHFLPENWAAEWIVYPVPANVQAQGLGDRTARFTSSFMLVEIPFPVTLQARAFGSLALTINEKPVALTSSSTGNWKQIQEADISEDLLVGLNKLDAFVTNDAGPPALWLRASGKDWTLTSNSKNWVATLEWAVPQPPRSASEPMPLRNGNTAGGGERALDSARAEWPTLLAFAGLAGALGALGWWLLRDPSRSVLIQKRWLPVTVVALALSWLALYLNNSPSLSFPIGFDSATHLQYVKYIQDKKALPLANEGWEMHQPPLFYLLSALGLGTFGLSTGQPAAISFIRLLNFGAAIAQIAFVGGCLRLLFPGRLMLQAASLIVCAFLPMELYMAHYPTNDVLAAAFATAAVYSALRVLQEDRPSSRRLLALGAILGAAVLTKITTLALVPVVLAALAAKRLMSARVPTRSPSLGQLVALPLFAFILVSGWHFGRVWYHFGTPLIGSFDPQSGYRWWQDPGYNTPTYFLRFGRSLTDPFFSEFNGFADGIYSTLWGDALWGGVSDRRGRPPWNYELMAVGYWLALLPTAAIAVGAIAALIQFVRRPTPEWGLLLGIAFVMSLAVVYHFLRLPYACHVKAFYGLPAAIALAAFAGRGFELLIRRSKLLGAILGLLLGTWAMTAFAAYWIRDGSPATEAWIGHQMAGKGEFQSALTHFQKALQADSDYEPAELAVANILGALNRRKEAVAIYQHVIARNPDSALAHLSLAQALDQPATRKEAIAHAETAIALAPDNVKARTLLGVLYVQEGRTRNALTAYRTALGKAPADAPLHHLLGMVLASQGTSDSMREAAYHGRKAIHWQPDYPPYLSWLGRLLATCPDAKTRSGPEALNLANQACELTRFQDPVMVDTLAAALAENGRYSEAVTVQKRAIALAERAAPASVPEMQKRLELYQTSQPYRETPKLR